MVVVDEMTASAQGLDIVWQVVLRIPVAMMGVKILSCPTDRAAVAKQPPRPLVEGFLLRRIFDIRRRHARL
jgi:hypothetical protein